MNEVHDLKELLRTIVADGDFGVTLRTGEPTVVHTRTGRRMIEGVHPTHEEITTFLRRLMGSRGVREFRDHGVTRFMVPFDDGVRLVGAARLEKDDIHVEIRRIVGSSKR
jgi:Tfp pilus assembly ATPase PilU